MTRSYSMLSSYSEIERAAAAGRTVAYYEYPNTMILPGEVAPVVRIGNDGIAAVTNMRWDVCLEHPESALRETFVAAGDILPCLIPVTLSSAHLTPVKFAAGHWRWIERRLADRVGQGRFWHFDFADHSSQAPKLLDSRADCDRWLEGGSPSACARMLFCDPLFNG